MKLNNTVFVVTGAGGGIGSEVVLGLLKKGSRVAAVDLKAESLDALSNQAAEYASNLSTHAIDISDLQAVTDLPEHVIASHGQIDGLINCAGIIQPFVKINDLDWKSINRVMNVNFYGTLYMTKSFLPHLLKRPESYLMNVSSMGGFLPVPGQGVYGASKAAVKLLTEALYAELLDTPVHVSVVFPGATKTNITSNSGVATPNTSDASTKDMNANMLSAKDAADIMINGIENNKPQIFTGSDSRLMNRFYRLSPVRATKMIASRMKSLLG